MYLIMILNEMSLIIAMILEFVCFIINNYSPKAKWVFSNNPGHEVEGIIPQYSLSLRRIIVLV